MYLRKPNAAESETLPLSYPQVH